MTCLIRSLWLLSLCLFPALPGSALEEIPLGGTSNSHLLIPTSTDYATSNLTVELWIRLDSADGYNILIARGPKQSGHWELYTNPGSGTLSLYAPDLNPVVVDTNHSLTDGQWHLVGWVQGGNQSQFFVDGVLIHSAPQSGSFPASSQPLSIGALVEGGLYCQGAIKACRISHIARNLTGVTPPLVSDPTTISLWRSQDRVNRTLSDQGSAGRSATWFGPAIPITPPLVSVPLGGEIAQRLFVDASPSYGALPITVEILIRLKPSSSYQILVAKGEKKPGHWELYTTPSSGNYSVFAYELNPPDSQTTISITDNQWHVVGWTCDGAVSRLYIDGLEVVTVPVSGSITPLNTPILIGGLLEGYFGTNGDFGGLRISNTTRDLTTVLPPWSVDAQTVSLWLPENLSGNVIPDLGPAGNEATLINNLSPPPFPQMLDEIERDEQLALPLSGLPIVDEEAALVPIHLPVHTGPAIPVGQGPPSLSLDGTWFLKDAEPGQGINLGYHQPGIIRSSWLHAEVPSTVQTTLVEEGVLPDPQYGERNMFRSFTEETREWWYVREFTVPSGWDGKSIELYFDGVDYTAKFYLNGHLLGTHRGMFGGPEFDVSSLLTFGNAMNTLAVCIDPPPPDWFGHPKPSVVFGWHYGHMISMGLWRSVELHQKPTCRIRDLFIQTQNLDGDIEVEFLIESDEVSPVSSVVMVDILPHNFDAPPESLQVKPLVMPGKQKFRFTHHIASPHLWWPLGQGAQDLYRMKVTLTQDAQTLGTEMRIFGIRTVKMEAAPGTWPAMYRWQFVINDRPLFIKGANWCFIDPYLSQDYEKYAHTLELTRRAGVQMLRVWGGGPIEWDGFYDLCNEKGIMVWQEFPYCFGVPDIPQTNPTVLDDQAWRVVRRLRNHPCLVMWAGGNEVQPNQPLNNALKLLGKRIRQFDPSRAYHITSPWGGDLHNWSIFHSGVPIEGYHDSPTVFLTEYGLPSNPNLESMTRYVSASSIAHWPPTSSQKDLTAHSQQFSIGDWGKMLTYAGNYGPVKNWNDFITFGQMAQADAFRYGAEMVQSHAGKGTCGYFFYKMTDIFPGHAWSVIDYYGVPKLSYYRVSRMLNPRHVFMTTDKFDFEPGSSFSSHIFVSNDSPLLLESGVVQLEMYNQNGQVFHTQSFSLPEISRDSTVQAGVIEHILPGDCQPFLVCLNLMDKTGSKQDESWYWFNYAQITPEVEAARALPHWGYPEDQMPDVFTAYQNLPPSRLKDSYPLTTLGITEWVSVGNNKWKAKVVNRGDVPAIFVTIQGLPGEYGYYLSDNAFFLKPGHSQYIEVEVPTGKDRPHLSVSAWNSRETVLLPPDEVGIRVY